MLLINVSEHQSAFIQDRYITNNALVAFEIIHYMKCKRVRKHEVAAMKIDMSKAHDRVDWGYREAIML